MADVYGILHNCIFELFAVEPENICQENFRAALERFVGTTNIETVADDERDAIFAVLAAYAAADDVRNAFENLSEDSDELNVFYDEFNAARETFYERLKRADLSVGSLVD